MAIDFNVDRVDILEGPPLDRLVETMATTSRRLRLKSGSDKRCSYVHFHKVMWLDDQGRDVSALLPGLSPLEAVVLSISVLGRDWSNPSDFVIAVGTSFGIFQGHYNAHTRKGSLANVE